jgi:hypothetical protein
MAASDCRGHVREWHKADIATVLNDAGVKRTSGGGASMSASGPKRTWTGCPATAARLQSGIPPRLLARADGE